MPVTEALATPDMEDTAMARGLLTPKPTTVELAMLVTEVSAMPDTEATATARGLPILRLTMVV